MIDCGPARASPTVNCMFFFFSNRFGCLGSIMISLIGTAVLVLILLGLNSR